MSLIWSSMEPKSLSALEEVIAGGPLRTAQRGKREAEGVEAGDLAASRAAFAAAARYTYGHIS